MPRNQEKIAARQLAKKIKLENQFKPELMRFFGQLSRDINVVWAATQNLPSMHSFQPELTALLRKQYRRTASAFKKELRNESKNFTPEETKQDEISNQVDSELSAYILAHSITQSNIILNTTQKELQTIVAREVVAGAVQEVPPTNIEMGNNIKRGFVANSAGRVDTIAMTETQNMAEITKFIETGAIAATFTGTQQAVKTWNTTLDERTRASHVAADRQQVPKDGVFIVQGQRLRFPGDTSLGASMSNIINCLHPSSIVQACNPKALTRRLYKGDMFIIEDSLGNNITVTPNHPILTMTGWKAARLIDKGDNIVATDNVKLMRLIDFNINNITTSIEEIYNSAGIVSRTVGVGTCDMNFHGDVSDHDVDIVLSDSLLRDAFKSFGCHVGNKVRFKRANFLKRFLFSESLVNKPFFSCFHIPARLIGFLGIPFSIFRGCLFHSKKHGVASAASDKTSFFQSIGDNASRNAKAITDFLDRKRFAKHVANGSDLFRFTKVVKAHKFTYSGYVYNIEDEQSYYICNGIVNHNCRCSSIVSIVGEEAPIALEPAIPLISTRLN